MKKSKLTPDPLRDAPKGHGDEQAPGPVAILPGRAVVDTRFARFPTALVVLARCCAHAKQYTATFWVNQSSIARTMGISQQAVSQHMQRLIEWGYIEKLRREDQRRKYGKKGALWRVIYDPTMSMKDVEAWASRQPLTEDEEQEALQETIEQANKGAKGQQSKRKKQPVDNSASHKPQLVETDKGNDNCYKLQLVQPHKTELVLNYYKELSSKKIEQNDCRRLCLQYAHAVNARWGQTYRHDMRQEALAAQLLGMGYTLDSFARDSASLLDYLRKNNKQPPASLQYFIARKQKQSQAKTPEDIVKQTVSKMKMP